MTETEDPRLTATREAALEAAVNILTNQGVTQLTHSELSKNTRISRSTLYRHWPNLEALRNSTFLKAATPPNIAPQVGGPLKADLLWLFGILVDALNQTAWGSIAPQVIAASSKDESARLVITEFMSARFRTVDKIFDAAKSRGEISETLETRPIIEFAIAVPYFKKLVLHEELNKLWLDSHVERIMKLAGQTVP